MFVCHCGAVTHREFASAIDGGAETIEHVSDETGAGAGCGGCHDSIRALLDERCGACPRRALSIVA